MSGMHMPWRTIKRPYAEVVNLSIWEIRCRLSSVKFIGLRLFALTL